MEKIYDKLVRDNIPDIIRSDGAEPITRILNDKEYWNYLLKYGLQISGYSRYKDNKLGSYPSYSFSLTFFA